MSKFCTLRCMLWLACSGVDLASIWLNSHIMYGTCLAATHAAAGLSYRRTTCSTSQTHQRQQEWPSRKASSQAAPPGSTPCGRIGAHTGQGTLKSTQSSSPPCQEKICLTVPAQLVNLLQMPCKQGNREARNQSGDDAKLGPCF
jgi:hypothetical protein